MPLRSVSHPASVPFARDSIFTRILHDRLAAFEIGSLRLELPNGRVLDHVGNWPGPAAIIVVKRWRLLQKLLLEGEIGLARAYVAGDWSTPDLEAVLDFGLHNQRAMSTSTRGLDIAHLWNRIAHRRNANTPRGSRRNIAAHYDLGNRFYAFWLDSDLNYSSVIFANATDTLETAQERKLDRIVNLLGLDGGESVLEIGCGWGSLARRIANAGAGSLTGISLSEEQIAHAQAAISASSLEDRITFQLRDYRTVSARYDRIVSIEMIEAVGERYWPVYFNRLRRSLKPGGCAVLQIITIAEKIFESYRARPDFIQRYIFPGGMLPTVEIIKAEAARAGFRLDHEEQFAHSYARTLDIWHERFNAAWPDIRQLGFDERFRRMWTYYLKYCAVGFRHRLIDVGLYKLSPA